MINGVMAIICVPIPISQSDVGKILTVLHVSELNEITAI